MNATRKITFGTLAAAAFFGGAMMAVWHWVKDTSEPRSGPNRIRAQAVGGPHSGSPLTPGQAHYRATTRFQINQTRVRDLFFSGFLPGTRDTLDTNWFEVQVKAVSSRSTLILAVKNLKLETEWKRSPYDAATRLAGMIKVEREPNADIVSLSAWSDKPEEATALANGVRDAYERRRREAAEERLRRLRQNLDNQIAQQQATVENARREMLELIKQQSIASPVSLVAMEGPQTSKIAGVANPAGPGVADQIAPAEPQMQPGYAAEHTRYESQVQLLNTILEHAERSAGEAASRNLVDILEPAVAVEDR